MNREWCLNGCYRQLGNTNFYEKTNDQNLNPETPKLPSYIKDITHF